MADKVGKSSRLKHVILIKIKGVPSKKCGLKFSGHWRSMSCYSTSSQSIAKDEEKILKVGAYDFISSKQLANPERGHQ